MAKKREAEEEAKDNEGPFREFRVFMFPFTLIFDSLILLDFLKFWVFGEYQEFTVTLSSLLDWFLS